MTFAAPRIWYLWLRREIHIQIHTNGPLNNSYSVCWQGDIFVQITPLSVRTLQIYPSCVYAKWTVAEITTLHYLNYWITEGSRGNWEEGRSDLCIL